MYEFEKTNDNTGQNVRSPKAVKGKSIRKRLIVCALCLAILLLINTVASLLVYNSFFVRYERPDYTIYPGLYNYELLEASLPRDEYRFASGDNMLQAYYYPGSDPQGLVILAHGYHAGADDYLPLIEAIVLGGYSVFTYDVAGTYSSGGSSIVGMCRSLVDLDSAINHVKSSEKYSDLPLYLVGHSWGGYAVASALELHPDVKACVCIAPMNSGPDVMIETAEEYVGILAYAAKPVFDIYQRMLFGNYVEYNGLRGINSCSVPVLIAQGVSDDVIRADGQSIYAHKNEIINPNVSYYLGSGAQGSHSGVWHSVASAEYISEINSLIGSLSAEKGRELTNDELREIYSAVDHRLYSEVNSELVSLMLKLFNENK